MSISNHDVLEEPFKLGHSSNFFESHTDNGLNRISVSQSASHWSRQLHFKYFQIAIHCVIGKTVHMLSIESFLM